MTNAEKTLNKLNSAMWAIRFLQKGLTRNPYRLTGAAYTIVLGLAGFSIGALIGAWLYIGGLA